MEHVICFGRQLSATCLRASRAGDNDQLLSRQMKEQCVSSALDWRTRRLRQAALDNRSGPQFIQGGREGGGGGSHQFHQTLTYITTFLVTDFFTYRWMM